MKPKPSKPVQKVKRALEQRPESVPAPRVDVTESFRRARASLDEITADLDHLRRRAATVVKGGRPAAKPK